MEFYIEELNVLISGKKNDLYNMGNLLLLVV